MQIVSNRDNLYEMSNLFYGIKNMKSITNLSSAELAQRVVKVKTCERLRKMQCVELLDIQQE